MSKRVKYPRTFHLPYGLTLSDDDKRLASDSIFSEMKVAVSEKMDGENTTVYSDGYIHARSLDGCKHPWQTWLKSYVQSWCYKIPTGWRVCGENHPNWDVNRTHEKRCKERKTTKDHIWRSTVFARDNRTCCKCGKDKKARMVVHHINSYDIHENQRYDIDNGIVMCEDCHKDFHSKYGYGKNTRTQFEEYLKAD